MPDRPATPINLEQTFRPVIDCLIDGQIGLRKIGEALQEPVLKSRFLEESLTRAEFRGNLESILHHQGVHDIEEHGTAAAALKRAWVETKAKLGADDQFLLEVAEQDQFAATKAYANALEQELPFPIRQALLSQAARIEYFHEYVQAVRKINKALTSA